MEIFKTRYCDSQTKIICQSYDPRKLVVQLTPMGPKIVGTSSPRVRVSHFSFVIKKPLSLIVTQFRRHITITSLLIDKLPSLELVYSILQQFEYLLLIN